MTTIARSYVKFHEVMDKLYMVTDYEEVYGETY